MSDYETRLKTSKEILEAVSQKLSRIKNRKTDICYNCKFYIESGFRYLKTEGSGNCVRFPPVTVHWQESYPWSTHSQKHQEVSASDWCGEHVKEEQ